MNIKINKPSLCQRRTLRALHHTLLFIILLFSHLSYAQQYESLPYRADFSSVEDNKLWFLNAGNTVNFANMWYIDQAGDSDGNMLYLSGDGGASPSYASKDNIVVSYRKFDMQAGKYDFAFDWKALGRDSSAACLFVVWCPESYMSISRMVSLNFYTSDSDFPLWMKSHMLDFNDGVGTSLFGHQDWTHVSSVLDCPTSGVYRLAFVWVNKKSDNINPPAACVDNIEIASVQCVKPHNFKCVGSFSSVTFSWDGTAPEYELKYTIMDENKWTVIDKINQNNVVLNNLPQGIYEVRIRAICNGDTSIWEHFPMTFVYETQCLDFLDLKSASCTHGVYDDPYQYKEYVDKGYKSMYSNHTIHYKKDEVDERTIHPTTKIGLKTVPDGEIASVRLGNWDVYRKAESITYDYKVDAKYASVLLLKYAVVMEDPGHDAKNQPRFRLEVLDSLGNLVDDMCGVADFRAKSGVDGWVTIPAPSANKSTVVWKDWTTVGLNLDMYDGQTLKIRLTTYDCNESGHFGYAYFTIGCTTGSIEGMNCGDFPTTEFIAPEGFNYRWYTENSELTDTLSKERIFKVDPSDRTHYLVDVIYPTESRCKFTLKASAIPRFPRAGMNMKHTPKECRNYMSFFDTSCIFTDEGVVSSNVDAVSWNFGNGRTSMDTSVVVEFPAEGYSFDSCYLVASLCNDMCTDTFWFALNVPSIISDTVYSTLDLCEGDTLFVAGDTITKGGDYTDTYVSKYTGCDSIVVFRVVERQSYSIYDTVSIIKGEEYLFGDEKLNKSGDYRYVFNSIHGCDSLVLLHLDVVNKLDVELLQIGEICHDQDSISIAFDVLEGLPMTIDVLFDEYASSVGKFKDVVLSYQKGVDLINIEMPESVLPDKYNVALVFSDGTVGTDTIEFVLDVRYSNSVIAQRWNDVLAIKNIQHNGGFDFTKFQWYADDMALEGETAPQLYVAEGFNRNAAYSVLLTRKTDGVSQFTCSFYPKEFADIPDQPTVYFAGDKYSVPILNNSTKQSIILRLYSLDGVLLHSAFSDESVVSIQLPFISGVYLLEIISENNRKVQKIVVRN